MATRLLTGPLRAQRTYGAPKSRPINSSPPSTQPKARSAPPTPVAHGPACAASATSVRHTGSLPQERSARSAAAAVLH
eukprot:2951417-Prymnesium_polylepis.1